MANIRHKAPGGRLADRRLPQHQHVPVCYTDSNVPKMGIFDPASSKGEDLQENAATSVERGLEADSQAVAGREPLGSESTPIVKPASASESVPRRETIDEIMDRRRKEKGLPPIRRIPDRSSEVKEG